MLRRLLLALMALAWLSAPGFAAVNLDAPIRETDSRGVCLNGRLIFSDDAGHVLDVALKARVSPGILAVLAKKWQLTITMVCLEPSPGPK
jgi:hypothetical protein